MRSVPLIRFRLATCGAAGRAGGGRAARRRSALDRHALLGRPPRIGIDDRPRDRSAEGPRASTPRAATHFRRPSLLTLAWANANLLGEEFEAALSGFDHVLTTQPTHRDALNGRMQSLSYLLRHDDAVAAATRLLDLGTWHIADANYWRAWNRYHLKDYDAAWADVENATRGLSNSRVYMLAGLIAYARNDLPIAVQRFDRAYELDSSACDATWMSGLVSIDQDELEHRRAEVHARHELLRQRRRGAAAGSRAHRASIVARGTPATAREQRRLERLRRDADNAEEKSAQSAYNAAQCYARTGQKTDGAEPDRRGDRASRR